MHLILVKCADEPQVWQNFMSEMVNQQMVIGSSPWFPSAWPLQTEQAEDENKGAVAVDLA